MENQTLTCPMCGHSFDPQAHPACPSCPINNSCTLACCPQCGYETVDPNRSTMVTLLRKMTAIIRPERVSGGKSIRET